MMTRGDERPADQPEETVEPRADASPETVEVTGARPATMTSSAVEARPEQAAIAPEEGSFTTEPARPVDTLPEEEQEKAANRSPPTARPAPGLEAAARDEQQNPDATVEGQPEQDLS